jgi:ribosome maturation factor RimP
MGLGELLERTIPALGYELVDWDMSARTRLVRVFIDKPIGVDVEDCARVSNHLTRLFAVENVDFERLEVSSPGLDRPVKRLADYDRFTGQEARLTLSAPVNGARRIKGILRGTEGEDVLVETPAGVMSFPFGTITQARLVPAIDWTKRLSAPGEAEGRAGARRGRRRARRTDRHEMIGPAQAGQGEKG